MENIADDYKMTQGRLERLLSSFYQATGISIGLYIGKNTAVITFPKEKEHAQFYFDLLSKEFLTLFREGERQADDAVAKRTTRDGAYALAMTPVGKEHQHIAYLAICASLQEITTEKMDAACNLLRPLSDYINEKEYVSLVWKKNVDSFRQMVWNYPNYEWNVASLVEAMHISKTTLYQHFKIYTGQTIAEYIKAIRLEKAQYLLTHTSDSVADISAAVGFDDYNYFLRNVI